MKGYGVARRLGGGSYGDMFMATIKEGEQRSTTIAVKVQNKTNEYATKTKEQNRELTLHITASLCNEIACVA